MSWGDMRLGSFKQMSKFEMIKQLENMVAFQANCLVEGDWENYDKVQNSITKLEKDILKHCENA